MGRARLKIQRLESYSNRQITFSKRRVGLVKKAEEISVLCDVDIILLMFSPSGKPILFSGGGSNLEEIIFKFSQLSPQERAKRKLEAFEALRKMFEKIDHDVDMGEFFDTRISSVEDMCNQIRMLQDKIFEVHQRLSRWMNPDEIQKMEHICQMEHLLKGTLGKIHQKLQNEMQLQWMMTGEIQMPSWGSADECQPITWYNHANLPSQRNVECALDTSITNCSDVMEMERDRTTENNGKVDSTRHSNAMDDTHSTGSLKFQPSEEREEFSWNTDVTSSDLRTLEPSGDLNLLADQMSFLDSDQINFLDLGFACNNMQHTFNADTVFNQG
ncbi:MADS box transcription factor [Lithospermum erythrorhizon]|uniref:MADS box transcription factor n=1 Tax=Lithospermum erythrorhizon TaxID=34254 RepID=A0AAV3PBL8_LITER